MTHPGHEKLQGHPTTFEEVIARGFPRGRKAAHAELSTGVARKALKHSKFAFTGAIATRKDETALSEEEKTAFKNAVSQLVQEGKYLEIVRHHMDMSHNMHGTMGETGLYRFLPWHRRYLVEFESELQRADKILRPTAAERLGVPYWRWQNEFPAWLAGFLPAPVPSTGEPPPARKNSPLPPKPNAVDVDTIVNHWGIQKPSLDHENDYTQFTYGIEGWGKRADSSPLYGHNHGHAWVGGIMNNTSTSPSDPIFWLHHAEIDRLWEAWRVNNSVPAPVLSGSDLVMDPWPEAYNDLLKTKDLGYSYDALAL